MDIGVKRAFLTADWRYLAMVSYEIDPSLLRPLVPRGTELDNWNGRIFISVVGFLFRNTRILGLSIPFHSDFEEINLRFYVRRQTEGGWRRGVVFIKEIVPRRAIAFTARHLYNENYIALPTSHVISTRNDGGDVKSAKYACTSHGAETYIEVITRGEPATLLDGSEESFIAQHYWGYVTQRDGGTLEYHVEHPPWRIWQSETSRVAGSFAEIYGASFAEALRARASSAFLAEGSAVVVHRARKIA